MSSILNDRVLVLNGNWQAVGEVTVEQAIHKMSTTYGKKSNVFRAYAVDTDTMRTVSWEEWCALPVRPGDKKFKTVRGEFRVPTLVVKSTYNKVPPVSRRKCNSRNVKDRDGAICQITGEYAPDGNMDHDVPQSRNGPTSWENTLWMKRELNQQKGDKTLAEMGWKPLKKPVAPKPLPVWKRIPVRHPDWQNFLQA
jgi:5-methylcytosine-specific restriction endonuclease McrA